MKVLIISYYWPPAGGPGVQRWLKFATYLPKYGIIPIIYTPSNPNYPIIDNALLSEVPDDIEVIRRPIFEPYKWATVLFGSKSKNIGSGILPTKNLAIIERFLLWIRGNLFIPDARRYWISPSVKYLSEYLIKEGIDTVISTGPPHSMHLIAQRLKARLKIRWIADFRDPWITIGYHRHLRMTDMVKKRHEALESAVLQDADKIIVTSPATQQEFEAKTDTSVSCITNGYDSPYFEKNVPLSKYFRITHVGSLLSERNPTVLWRVLQKLVDEHLDFAEQLKLSFVGKVSQEVIDSLHHYGLESYLDLPGYLPHHEAIFAMQSAPLLLLTEINHPDNAHIVPGKLFEYLAARRQILGFGPKNWAAEAILKQIGVGNVCAYNDIETAERLVLATYQDFKEQRLDLPNKDLTKYHRRTLTKTLATLLHG